MTELIGQTYYRIVLEFVEAAELPEDTQFGNILFLRGDFVVKHKDGTQIPMKRESFFRHYQRPVDAIPVYDSIDQNERIIKYDQSEIDRKTIKIETQSNETVAEIQ